MAREGVYLGLDPSFPASHARLLSFRKVRSSGMGGLNKKEMWDAGLFPLKVNHTELNIISITPESQDMHTMSLLLYSNCALLNSNTRSQIRICAKPWAGHWGSSDGREYLFPVGLSCQPGDRPKSVFNAKGEHRVIYVLSTCTCV